MSSPRDATVTCPEIRAATLPLLSINTVEGMALAGKVPLKPIKSESSMKVGYGIANLRANASAVAGLSRVKIPINCTSGYCLESSISVGISARQGEHQDAQTFTTATCPGLKVKVFPLSVIPDKAGAAFRFEISILVTAPLPSIKLSSGVEVPPPQPVNEIKEKITSAIKEVCLRIDLITSSAVVNVRLAQSKRAQRLRRRHQSEYLSQMPMYIRVCGDHVTSNGLQLRYV